MAKVLLLVALVLVSVSAIPVQKERSFSLGSENYKGMRALIDGLVSGFLDRDYSLSDDCLSSEKQSALDEAVINAFFQLIKGHFEEFVKSIESMFSLLTTIFSDCDLGVFYTSAVYDITNKGVMHVIMNTFWHSADIAAGILDGLADLVTLNFENAGKAWGKVVGMIFEPHEPWIVNA
jgi:hypothetical protein